MNKKNKNMKPKKNKEYDFYLLFFDYDKQHAIVAKKYCNKVVVEDDASTKDKYFKVQFEVPEEPLIGKLISTGTKKDLEEYLLKNGLNQNSNENKENIPIGVTSIKRNNCV